MTVAGERRLCLVLTATINPDGMPFTRRNAPHIRLEDYRKALKRWSNSTDFDSIILCENSDHDLSALSRTVDGAVQFLSFSGNDYARHFGKGYGEMNILKHVLNEVRLGADDLIVKVTGRYFVLNASTLSAYMKHNPDYEIFCDFAGDRTFANSVMFAGTVRFFKEYLLVRQTRINDTAGVYFEHALAEGVHEAERDGLRWAPFPEPPRIEGISGTFDRNYNPSLLEKCRDQLVNGVWYFALALTKPIRRRVGVDKEHILVLFARLKKSLLGRVSDCGR